MRDLTTAQADLKHYTGAVEARKRVADLEARPDGLFGTDWNEHKRYGSHALRVREAKRHSFLAWTRWLEAQKAEAAAIVEALTPERSPAQRYADSLPFSYAMPSNDTVLFAAPERADSLAVVVTNAREAGCTSIYVEGDEVSVRF